METITGTATRQQLAIGRGAEEARPRHDTFITPVLPKLAIQQIKEHVTRIRQPVFTRVLAQIPVSDCKNCTGLGGFIVVFCKSGPFKYVPAGKDVITWWEGNGEFPKGWYIVDRTVSYDCPKCKKGVS